MAAQFQAASADGRGWIGFDELAIGRNPPTASLSQAASFSSLAIWFM